MTFYLDSLKARFGSPHPSFGCGLSLETLIAVSYTSPLLRIDNKKVNGTRSMNPRWRRWSNPVIPVVGEVSWENRARAIVYYLFVSLQKHRSGSIEWHLKSEEINQAQMNSRTWTKSTDRLFHPSQFKLTTIAPIYLTDIKNSRNFFNLTNKPCFYFFNY